jgi:hypothetical protein
VNLRDPNGTGWLGDAIDSVQSKVQEIRRSPTFKVIHTIADYLDDAVDVYDAAKCLKEQLDCEDEEGRPCRCDKNLSGAGKASCELNATVKCSEASLRCIADALLPDWKDLLLFGSAPLN